jgi:soluble lytic murein transglycosylase-like protein
MAARNLKAMADAAARRYGVPPGLFRRLIQQESGWNPNAYNPSGATGLVQIHLPSHPDISAEQARDPAFALAWGARYLATQKQRFKRWDLALAAYNAGPGNVESGKWRSFPETAN